MCDISKLSRVKGTLDVELLAAKSDQLVQLVQPVLKCLLELRPDAGSPVSLLDSVPVLTLHFHPKSSVRHVPLVDRASVLNAFAALAKQSQRLNAFPEAKSAFWMDVLGSKMPVNHTRDVHRSSFKNPEFPRFVIDFGHYQHACEVDEAFGDLLFTFMTTPATMQTVALHQEECTTTMEVASTSSDTLVAFGFSFSYSRLTSAALETIERFLDRAFASPDRQYGVRMLDFSRNDMSAPELTIVARMIQKKRVYQFEELNLERVLKSNGLDRYRAPDETPSEFLDIMRAAFDLRKLPQVTSRALSEPNSSTDEAPSKTVSQLRKISMRDSYLCPKFFASLFSALRYGCPLGQDVSGYTAKRHVLQQEAENYWRWLAFGLFYPRPKRFADKFKLRSLGRLECDHKAVETFAKTLRNPVAELVYQGVVPPGERLSEVDTLMVCTVKQGASIEIFESGFGSSSKWTDTLSEGSELEALCEREDGSVCVVVPGVGLGWVRPESIKCIERESLGSRRSQQDGLYDVQLGNAHNIVSPETEQGLRSMIELIGRQVRSLSFDYVGNKRSFVQFILANCVNLQQLSLANVKSFPADGDTLIEALRGDLGSHLLSLNLNWFIRLKNVLARKLAAVLADTEHLPVLRELRLHGVRLALDGLAALHQALEVNRTLALIELTGESYLFSRDTNRKAHDHLDASYQGQLLEKAIPMKTKLAFLSVVNNKACSGKKATALNSLDSWLLSQVFAFAANPKVRRQIAWNTEIQGPW